MKLSRIVPLLVLAALLALVWRSTARRPGAPAPRVAASAAEAAQPPAPSVPPPAPPRPVAPAAAPAPVPAAFAAHIFGARGPVTIDDVPAGRFREQLLQLSPAAREHALAMLGRLHVPRNDVVALATDRDGQLYYECARPPAAAQSEATAAAPAAQTASAAPVPIATPPIRHSRPGAARVLYLDFNGHTVTGTAWNLAGPNRAAVDAYVCLPYTTDSDGATFSDADQAAIIEIWQRVAEDYSAFDVDVTTEEPATFTAQTLRALITRTWDAKGVLNPSGASSSGVAYLDVFGHADLATYSPVFVYYDTLSGPASIADVVSHELGHNLALSHDGTSTSSYYYGHGTGSLSWGPIMGAPWSRAVTQWSKGDYYDANNPQDDLAIIAARLPLRTDVVGNSLATATAAPTNGNDVSATDTLLSAGESHFHRVVTAAGKIAFNVAPVPYGNSDLRLELLDSAGNSITAADPADARSATFTTVNSVPGGTYYLKVSAAGAGTPLANPPSGYTAYGSIGQYSLTGTVVAAPPVIVSATSASVGVGHKFDYQTQVVGFAASFAATGLPPGLTFDSATGALTGRATAAGVYSIALSATNSIGSGQATLTLTVTDAAPAVTAASAPATVLTASESTTLSVTGFSVNGAISYQWFRNGRAIPGATGTTYNVSAANERGLTAYWVALTNSIGTTRSAPFFVRVAPQITKVRAWGTDNYYGQQNVPGGLGRVVDVAAGVSHSIALRADGALVSWGSEKNTPAVSDAVAVAAGYGFSLALRRDGTVAAFKGISLAGYAQIVPADLRDVVAIAAGSYHALALKSDGTVVTWGYSDPTLTTPNLVTPPAGLSNVVAIAAGANYSLALKSDGTVVGWGGSDSEVPTALVGVKAIASGGGRSLALKSGGTTVSWGSSSVAPGVIDENSSLAVGGLGVFVAAPDGRVRAWGGSSSALPPADLAGVFRLSASGSHVLAVCDAAGDSAPTVTVSPASTLCALGASVTFSVTATGPGALAYQWRKDNVAIAGATAATYTIAAVQAGDAATYDVVVSNHAGSIASAAASLTVEAPPTIASAPAASTVATLGAPLTLSVSATSANAPLTYQWKKNNRVLAGATSATLTLSSFSTADAGAYVLEITDAHGLRSRVLTFVRADLGPTQVAIWGQSSLLANTSTVLPVDAVAIATTEYNALALRADGHVAIWGYGGSDALKTALAAVTRGVAIGMRGSSAYHVLRDDGRILTWDWRGAVSTEPYVDVIAISASSNFSTALLADGTVRVWGGYSNPLVPDGLDHVTAISAGISHVLALRTDGTVAAFGSNSSGQCNVPAGLTGVVAVAAGANHSLALKSDGTVVGWGTLYGDSVNPPADLGPVTAIFAGNSYSLALRADGTLRVWSTTDRQLTRIPAPAAKLLALGGGPYTAAYIRASTDDIAPSIVRQPAAVVTGAGMPQRFTVLAAGAGPLRYQWRKDGTPLPDQTAAFLDIFDPQPADAGSYDVVVTNHVGSATSAAAALTIVTPPAITTPLPRRFLANAGQNVRLSATASSAFGPLAYQWKKNNRILVGATTATYEIAAFTAADAGAYTLEITDSRGAVSRATTFVVADVGATQVKVWGDYLPTQPPPDLHDVYTVRTGNAALLRSGSLVAWNNGAYVATGLPSTTLPFVDAIRGSSVSDPAWLALRADGVIVGTSGASANSVAFNIPGSLRGVIALARTTYTALALASDGRVYRWGSSGGVFALETGDVPVSAVAGGDAHVAMLRVDGTVAVTGNSNNYYGELDVPVGLANVVAIAAGSWHTLALKADGTVVAWGENYSHQCDVPTNLSGVIAIGADYNSSYALKADGTLVRWGNGNSSYTTAPSAFTPAIAFAPNSSEAIILRSASADAAPTITTQPSGGGLRAAGDALALRVSATGAGSLAYQWRKDGTPLARATSATFTLGSLQAGDAGRYDVVVSNHVGSVVSDSVVIDVSVPPALTTAAAARQLVAVGSPLSLSFTATSDFGPVALQWKKNNRPIVGATSATLSFANVTRADAGAYTLEATDTRGLVTRSTVFVLPTGPSLIRAWGSNSYGETNVPGAARSAALAIAVGGNASFALLVDGTVAGWGQLGSIKARVPDGLSSVVAVSPGSGFALALRADGTVTQWTAYSERALSLRDVIAISAGENIAAALRADGTVVVLNTSGDVLDTLPSTAGPFTAVAAGLYHVLALRLDGAVQAWTAEPTYSPAPAKVPTGLSGVVAIAAGGNRSLALRSDGSVAAWGDEATLQAIGPGGATMIGGGGGGAGAVLSDGTLGVWSNYSSEIRAVPADLGSVQQFALGYTHGLALVAAGAGSPPTISRAPASTTRAPGDYALFDLAAAGTGPLAYQWRKNGVAIVGANASALMLSPLAADDAASYDVVVSNSWGSVTSAAATLTVSPGPQVTSAPPTRVAVALGTPVTLTAVAASDFGPLAYQWKKENRPLAGATSATLALGNLGADQTGAYTLEITDARGAVTRVTSFVFAARSHTQLRIFGDVGYNAFTTPPIDLGDTAVAATLLSDRVLVTRADGTAIRWAPTSSAADGRQAASLPGLTDVVAMTYSNSRYFALRADGTVSVSGYYDMTWSTVAGLSDVIAIANAGSTMLALRSNGTVAEWGYDANYTYSGYSSYNPTSITNAFKTVGAALRDVVSISAQGGSSSVVAVRLDGTVAAWSNNYSMPGIVSGASAIRDIARVALASSGAVAMRNDHTLVSWGHASYEAIGALPTLSDVLDIAAGDYHAIALRSNGAIAGWGGYSAPVLPSGPFGAFAVAANGNRVLVLRDASGDAAPSIVTPPASQAVVLGANATFSVTVAGPDPYSYQWRKDGLAIPGATAATLVVPAVSPVDAGQYDVIVSNRGGSVTSAAAALTITSPVGFATSPNPRQVVARGSALTLTHTLTDPASGSVVRWYFNNRLIPGANSLSYTIPAVTDQTAGAYTLAVTSATGVTVRVTTFVRPAGGLTRVRAWGANAYGQTAVPAALGNVVAISAGTNHVLALRDDGVVVAWGDNGSNQCRVPTSLTDVVAVAAGGSHSLALRADGTVVSWGSNGYAIPADLRDVIAIAADGSRSVALKSDGSVVVWGDYTSSIMPPAAAKDIVAIASGSYHVVALKSDGTVVAWSYSGYNSAESAVPDDLTDVVAIAASYGQTAAITRSGRLSVLGSSAGGVALGATPVALVDCGPGYGIVRKTDGGWLSWGDNTNKVREIPADLTNVRALSAGGTFVVALCDATGDATPTISAQPQDLLAAPGSRASFVVTATGPGVLGYQWRFNGTPIAGATAAKLTLADIGSAQAGGYDVVITNHAGSVSSRLATLALGTPPAFTSAPPTRTLIAPGQALTLTGAATTDYGPVTYRWKKNNRPITGATAATFSLASFTAADAGAYTLEATDARGLVARTTAFVLPDYGPTEVINIGGGSYAGALSAVPTGINSASSVIAGQAYSAALRRDGAVIVWGDRYSPAVSNLPANLTDVVAIAGGPYHVLALRADGTIVAWGNNSYGESTVPANLRDVIGIAAGPAVSVAIQGDGSVVVWGYPSAAGVQPPKTLAEVSSVALSSVASYSSAVAIAVQVDGTVVAWGVGDNSPLSPPVGLADVSTLGVGYSHVLALRGDGTLASWGSNSTTTLAPPSGTYRRIGAFDSRSGAVKADGTLVLWGSTNGNGENTVPGGLADVVELALGGYHTVALRTAVADALPVIAAQPVASVVARGSTATLSVAVTSARPLTYQWRRTGTPIAGATSSTLTLANVQDTAAGDYDVVVSNAAGSVTSAVATLTVETPPAISSAPDARQLVALGASRTLTFSATSAHAPLSYRWKKNNRVLAGATTASLTLTNFTAADAGAYTLEITDALGLLTRATTFVLPDYGRTQVRAWGYPANWRFDVPTDLTDGIAVATDTAKTAVLRANGTVAILGGDANGTPPPADLADAVGVAIYSYDALALRKDGTVVGWGSYPAPPAGLRDVIAVAIGERARAALRADGTVVTWARYSYQTAPQPPANLTDAVAIAVGSSQCLALKSDGTVVNWGDSSSTLPAGLTDVVAISASAGTYSALKSDGTLIRWGGASITDALPTFKAVSLGGYYYVIGQSADGTLVGYGRPGNDSGQTQIPADLGPVLGFSASDGYVVALRDARLDVAPALTAEPQSAKLNPGARYTFNVSATGSGPFTYQWFKDGMPIAGAAAATFTLSDVAASDVGNYTVRVSNHIGSRVSGPASLSLLAAPQFTVRPARRVGATLGQSVTLSATVVAASADSGALRYQWKKNSRPIAGATTATLTLPSFTFADAGVYTLEVSDALGAVARHTSFVLPQGAPTEVRVWGSAALAPPSDLTDAVKVAVTGAGPGGVALRANGRVVSWGGYSSPRAPVGLDRVVDLAVGTGSNAIALREDQTVVTFGVSRLIDPPASAIDVVAVAAGREHFLVLRADGRVVAWPASTYSSSYNGETTVPAGLKDVVAIAAWGSTNAALTASGDIVFWGANRGKILAVDFRDIADLSLGERHVLARKPDGTVLASVLSYTYNGETTVPADLGAAAAILAGSGVSFALKPDGTVRSWGTGGLGTPPANLTDVVGLAVAESVAAALRVTANDIAPAVVTSPASRNLSIGARLDLSVEATGTGPLLYQWRRDGIAITGATASTFTVAAVGAADAGAYDVVVSNRRGSATSAAATVAVAAGPAIVTAPPARVVVAPGQSVTLNVAATVASGSIGYRWKKNNRAIAGATAATYSIGAASPADAGAYTVEVSDSTGRITRRTSFVLVAPSATQLVGFGDGSGSYGLTRLPENITGPLLGIATGGSRNLVLKADGTVAGWGYDSNGANTPPASLTDAVAISVAGDYSLALKSDGTVVSWGYSYWGASAVPRGLSSVVAISAGSAHALALKSDGSVVTWGYTGNTPGSLAVPANLTDVVAIHAATEYSLAVRADGTVVVWGDPSNGQGTGAVGQTGLAKAIGASYAALGLKLDGTVVGWGSNSYSQLTIPASLSGVSDLAISSNHALALKADGTVATWGNSYYSATAVPAGLNKAFAIAAGSERSLVLRDASADAVPTITTSPQSLDAAEGTTASIVVVATGLGTLTYQWRHDGVALPGATSATLSFSALELKHAGSYDVVVSNHVGSVTSSAATLTIRPLPTVTTQSARRVVARPGDSAQLAVTAAGTGALSYQWRHNNQPIAGATEATLALSNVSRADNGWYVCAITDANGTRLAPPQWVLVAPAHTQTIAWGANTSHQTEVPVGLNDIVAVSAGARHSLALRRDGTVAVWGSSSSLSSSAVVAGVVAVAGDSNSSYTLHSDGSLRRWGGYGSLAVPSGAPFVAISSAGDNNVALRADGSAVTWSYYSNTATLAPAEATGLSTAVAGGSFFVGLKPDGTLVQWGSYAPTLPIGLAGVRAIAAGDNHVLALKTDGTVVAWGNNSSGQCDVPANLTGVVAIAASGTASFALAADGTLVTWGNNTNGERNGPASANALFAIAGAAGANHILALRDTAADEVPMLASSPTDLVTASGERALLRVVATGSGPFTYVWRKNGAVIASATTATLNFDMVSAIDAGSYTVEVANHIGSIVSAPAIITVENAPTFTQRPTARLVGTPGTALTLTGAATSDYLPITYQWNKDNRPIPGATSPTLSLASFTNADAGAYTLVATDAHGHKAYATSFVLPTYGAVQVRSTSYSWTPPSGLGAVIDCVPTNAGGLALRADGTVAGWGGSSASVVPSGVDNIVRIVSSSGHSLALHADGTVVGWGDNYSGAVSVPARAVNVVALATGASHSLALRADGSVIAWGSNDSHQCDVPADLTSVVAISAFANFSAAVKSDGTVTVWGDSTYGVTNVPTNLSGVIRIALGYAHALALKSDGTVVAWGAVNYNYGQVTVPPSLSGVVEIAAGGYASYARGADSTISVWGSQSSAISFADLGTIYRLRAVADTMLVLRDTSNDTVPTITTQPTGAIATAGTYLISFSVGATGFGPFTYQWRRNGQPLSGQTNASLYLYNLTEANAGSYDVVVSNHIGSVTSSAVTLTVTAGGGGSGNGPTITSPAASRVNATIGQPVSLTLSATGNGPLAYQWFHDNRPITGATSNTLAIASFTRADAGAYTLAVTDSANNVSRRTVFVLPPSANTFVVGAGDDSLGQATPPPSLTDAVALATGETHSLALRSNGTVAAWGSDVQNQSTVPANLDSVVAVAAAAYHSLALKSDGTVVGWGPSSSNLASGGSSYRNLIALAAGYNICAGLRDDGSVVSWGSVYYSPPTLSNAVAITAGADHAVALRLDGTVAAWGDNAFGQTTVPAGLSGVTVIAAGYRHTLALKSDGTVVAWGRNHVGQATVPVTTAKFVAVAAGADWSAAKTADGTWVVWGAVLSTGPGLVTNFGTPIAESWGPRHTLLLFDRVDLQLPVITAHPQSENVAAGAGLTLGVTATGSGTLAYQWFRDGAPLTDGPSRVGAQSSTLRVSNFGATDAGNYAVAVTNSHGTVTSLTAVITYSATPQTIDFPALASRTFTATPIVLGATASSGLPVSYTVVSGPATVSGDTLTLVGAGTVVVRAEQAGNTAYAPAAAVERSLIVTNASANVVLADLDRTYDGAPKPVSASTAPANLAIRISYEGAAAAPTAPGRYSVFATITDARYSGSAAATLTITKAAQTITFAGPANQPFSTAPITLVASASSALDVTFSVVSGPAAIAGNTLTLLGSGTVTVRASQAGDENYLAASDVDRTFVVGTTFDAWRLTYFTAEELLDASISGPNADPDHDGFVNLTEYALGTDPRANSAANAPLMSTNAGNWTFTYARPADRSDISYAVEYSTNLTTWSSAGVTHTLESSSNGVETWRATYPVAGTPTCFFRLVVTH